MEFGKNVNRELNDSITIMREPGWDTLQECSKEV